MYIKILGSLFIGVSVAATPGPVFFILIKRTLSKGFWQGVLVALGEFTGNFIVLFTIFFWASHLFNNQVVKTIFYLVGGFILLWLGIGAFRMNVAEVSRSYEVNSAKDKQTSYLTGFILAVLNIDVAILWISLSGSYLKNIESHVLAFINILSIALGFLLFFIPLAYIVDKVRHNIPENKVVLLSRASGVFLAIFALILFHQAIKLILRI